MVMQREQMALEVNKALELAGRHEWRLLTIFLEDLSHTLTETPIDIQWDEEKIRMIDK